MYTSLTNEPGFEETAFPPNVGIKVGAGTHYRSLILLTHFPELRLLPNNSTTGESEVVVTLVRPGKDFKRAFSLTMDANGLIGPHRTGWVSGAFVLDEPVVIHPISAWSHAHEFGFRGRLWVARPGQDVWDWELLLDVDNYKHQGDHRIAGNVTVFPGDSFQFRCDYNNTMDQVLVVM